VKVLVFRLNIEILRFSSGLAVVQFEAEFVLFQAGSPASTNS
jgi:hypothetical protein